MSVRSSSPTTIAAANNHGNEQLTGSDPLAPASPVNDEASSKLPAVPASSLRASSSLHQLSDAKNTANDASETEPAEEPWDIIRPAQHTRVTHAALENINQQTNAFLELIRLLDTATHPLAYSDYKNIFDQCANALARSKQLVDTAIASGRLREEDKYSLIDVLFEQTQQCFNVLFETNLVDIQENKAKVITTLIVNLLVRCCQCSYNSESPRENGSLYEKSVLCFLNPIARHYSQLRILIASTQHPNHRASLESSFICFVQRIQENHFFSRIRAENGRIVNHRFNHLPSFFQLITLGLVLCSKSNNEELKTLLAYGCDKLARNYPDFFKLCLLDSQQESPVNYADSLKHWRRLNDARGTEEASQRTTTVTPTQIKFLTHIAENHYDTGYINADFITRGRNTIQRLVYGLFSTATDDGQPITTVLEAIPFPGMVQSALPAIRQKSHLDSNIIRPTLEEFFEFLITGAADQIAAARKPMQRHASTSDLPDAASGHRSMRRYASASSQRSSGSAASSHHSISTSELKALIGTRPNIHQTEITLSLPSQETDEGADKKQ